MAVDITSIDGELGLAMIAPNQRCEEFESLIEQARLVKSDTGEIIPAVLSEDQYVYMTFLSQDDDWRLCGVAGVRTYPYVGYIDFIVSWGPRAGALVHYAESHFEDHDVDIRARATPFMLENEYARRRFRIVGQPDENGVCVVERRVRRQPSEDFLLRPYDEVLAERDRDYFAAARLRVPVRAEELRCMNAWQELGDPREPWLVHCPRTHRFLGIGVYEIGPREWDVLKIVLPANLALHPAMAAGGWRQHPAGARFVPHQSQIDAGSV